MKNPKKVKTKDKTLGARNSEVDDIVFMLRPLSIAEKIVGIVRYSVKDGKLSTPHVSLRIYGVAVFVVLILMIIINSFTLKYNLFVPYRQTLSEKTYFGFRFPIICAFLIHILPDFSKNNINVVIGLANIDKILNQPTNVRSRHRRYLIAGLFVGVLRLFFVVVFYCTISHFSVYLGVYLLVSFSIMHLELFAFLVFLKMLTVRLDLIYNELKAFTYSQVKCHDLLLKDNRIRNRDIIKYVADDNNQSIPRTQLTFLAKALSVAGVTVTNICKAFQCDILASIASIFLQNIEAVFILFDSMRSKDLWETFCAVYYALINDIWLVIICHVSGKVQLRCHSIRKQLKLLQNGDVIKSVRTQAKMIDEVLQGNTMRVVIYDMFNVDMKFILGFFSVCTTYLILLIQINDFL